VVRLAHEGVVVVPTSAENNNSKERVIVIFDLQTFI